MKYSQESLTHGRQLSFLHTKENSSLPSQFISFSHSTVALLSLQVLYTESQEQRRRIKKKGP